MTGGQLRLGLPFTEEFTLTLRYSLYPAGSRDPERLQAALQRLLGADSRLHGLNPPRLARGRHAEPLLLRRQRRSVAGDQGICRARP